MLDRAPGLEQLPTADELGFKGLDCGSWGALVFPRGTPEPIVRRLAKAANETVDSPAVRQRLGEVGVTVPAAERRTPEYLAKFIPSRDRALGRADPRQRGDGGLKTGGVVARMERSANTG